MYTKMYLTAHNIMYVHFLELNNKYIYAHIHNDEIENIHTL